MEAELHDDRVRLGPSAAVDHEADAPLEAGLAFVSVDLQQLGAGALEGVRIGRTPICFVDEQQRLAELVEWRDALWRRADELGERWRARRRHVGDGEDEAAAAGDGALEGLIWRVADCADELAEAWVVGGRDDLVARAAARVDLLVGR